MSWKQRLEKAERSMKEGDYRTAAYHVQEGYLAITDSDDSTALASCDAARRLLQQTKHKYKQQDWQFYLSKAKESFAGKDVALAKYQAAWAYTEALKKNNEPAAKTVEKYRQMLAGHKSKPFYPEKGWEMQLQELQDGIGGEDWLVKLEEAYVEALADYNEYAMEQLQKMLTAGKSGFTSPYASKYKDADYWGCGLNNARELLKNKRYDELVRECEKLLASLPLPEPVGTPKEREVERRARYEQEGLIKVMYIQAQIGLHRPECAGPLVEDPGFRFWLKWNRDPNVKNNKSFATYYYQIVPLLPVGSWLKDHPRLRTDGCSELGASVVPAINSDPLWEELFPYLVDCETWNFPANSTKERFADGLFSQAFDLEAQAFRIVLTDVCANLDYVEVNDAQKRAMMSALNNGSKYPRAIERLELASAKIKRALTLFDRNEYHEQCFANWEAVLTEQKELLGK